MSDVITFPSVTIHDWFSLSLTENPVFSGHLGMTLVDRLSSRGRTNAPILFGNGLNCRELQLGGPRGILMCGGWKKFKHILFWDCIKERENDKFVPG